MLIFCARSSFSTRHNSFLMDMYHRISPVAAHEPLERAGHGFEVSSDLRLSPVEACASVQLQSRSRT